MQRLEFSIILQIQRQFFIHTAGEAIHQRTRQAGLPDDDFFADAFTSAANKSSAATI
ncbi:MAG: hypothetical protein FD135_1760 [Comamonadaceae bacterium]|nr:MAG: hypothetical protein FD135_1760 [Comamonadaceae bacterium]